MSVQQICCNLPVGMHTVGVKVNLITRKYTYLRKNRVQIRKSPRSTLVPRPPHLEGSTPYRQISLRLKRQHLRGYLNTRNILGGSYRGIIVDSFMNAI